MPFLLAEILNFQGSTHLIGVGSFSKLVISLNSAFKTIDENLAEIVRHLSGTISEIEETTERVPQVVQASYAGMKDSFDEMKQRYEALTSALGLMTHTLERYHDNFNEERKG